MDSFREIAHLKEQLGDERFAVLIDSDNTGKVKEFCDQLVNDALPTEMTVGGRTYEILGFLRGDERLVNGNIMVERAKEMNANLGQDDGKHILKHQDEIPVSLRGKAAFVFTEWRHPDDPESALYVSWRGVRWVRGWHWLGHDVWRGRGRLLRCK